MCKLARLVHTMQTNSSKSNSLGEQSDSSFRGSPLLGILSLAVLGPIAIVGAFVCVSAGLAAFFGVDISWLALKTPIDFLYNPSFPLDLGGPTPTAAHYVAFMVGGVSSSLAAAGVWWSFTGRTFF